MPWSCHPKMRQRWGQPKMSLGMEVRAGSLGCVLQETISEQLRARLLSLGLGWLSLGALGTSGTPHHSKA